MNGIEATVNPDNAALCVRFSFGDEHWPEGAGTSDIEQTGSNFQLEKATIDGGACSDGRRWILPGVCIQVFTKSLERIQREDASGIDRVVRLDRVNHTDHGMAECLL
jgi:hypothetical protein